MAFCNARRFFLLKLFCQGCKISPMRLFTLAMCSLFAVFTPKPLLLRLITEHEDSPQHIIPLLPAVCKSVQPYIYFRAASSGQRLFFFVPHTHSMSPTSALPMPDRFPDFCRAPEITAIFPASHCALSPAVLLAHSHCAALCVLRSHRQFMCVHTSRSQQGAFAPHKKTSPAACVTARSRKRGCFQCLASQP